MTADYLTEALRACRLPISVSCDLEGEFAIYDWSTRRGVCDDDMDLMRRIYVDLRNELTEYVETELRLLQKREMES